MRLANESSLSKRSLGAMLGTVAIALVAAGCGGSSTSDATASSTEATSSSAAAHPVSAGCDHVAAPMLTIDAKTPDEPKVEIPQPAGWTRNTQLDNNIVRLALVNPQLDAHGFTSNLVVTIENATGKAASPQALIRAEEPASVKEDASFTSTPGTLCGFESATNRYHLPPSGTLPERSVTGLVVAVPVGNSLYGITVTVQTADADNPQYTKDLDTVLAGFAVKR